MTTFWEVAPLSEPTLSIALTTSAPSTILPKTTCLPSSHEVWAVQMKNCEPLAGGGWGRNKAVVLSRASRTKQEQEEEEEQRTVGAPVGHGESAEATVLEVEVLIGEGGTINWLTAATITPREVTALAHEAGNDPVEGASLVVELLARGACLTWEEKFDLNLI